MTENNNNNQLQSTENGRPNQVIKVGKRPVQYKDAKRNNRPKQNNVTNQNAQSNQKPSNNQSANNQVKKENIFARVKNNLIGNKNAKNNSEQNKNAQRTNNTKHKKVQSANAQKNKNVNKMQSNTVIEDENLLNENLLANVPQVKEITGKKILVENEKQKIDLTTKHYKNKNLKVMFFGGVGNVGSNITALMYGDDILVIDAGVGFADATMPGVDLIIPDFTWLKANKDKIKGVCVTHAHEDHIGGMPYFFFFFLAPVYASRLSLAFIENKLREFPKCKLKGVAVKPRQSVKIGCFTVEFIHVNHSMAGAYALSITTPVGVVYHSGDFKIDLTPTFGETTDLARIGEIGNKGVLLMLCESTNIERSGTSLSESVVSETLAKIFEECSENRIIITAFASNVHRVQEIMKLAKKNGRKVAFAGRSMINNMEVAMKIGEIKFDHDQIIEMGKVSKMKDKEVLILATGSQGQEHTALDRMVSGEIQGIEIGKNDTVIFSSSPVPGNEKSVTRIINELMRKGANVIYDDLSDVHASGHACQVESAIIHKLVRPRFFVPIHGEVKHLMYHEKFAIKMGVKPNNIIVPEVGTVVEVNKNSIRKGKDVYAGIKIVDGKSVSDAESNVLRDRLQLATDGICIVLLHTDRETGKLSRSPDIFTRGFIYNDDSNELIVEAKKLVFDTLKNIDVKSMEKTELRNTIKKTLTNLFVKRVNRKPMIVTIV